MPVKYIGRTTDYSGKTLWEIVGNLKNFGVGRLVKRNMFERYPEPSYHRIIKVETLPNEEVGTLYNSKINGSSLCFFQYCTNLTFKLQIK